MTGEEYSKKYDLAINFKIMAKEAFNEGLKQGRSENETKRFNKLKREVIKLREENKWMNGVLNDPEKLADWIGGI